VSWAARSTDDTGDVTSPEELIAAAHAACFSKALAGVAEIGLEARLAS
jgi:organic hydroperoxide reductase OsmC/OhrA